MKREKLQYSPIKEVIVGIAAENLYDSNEVVNNFYENFSLKNKFTHFEPTKAFTFEVQQEPAIAQNVENGAILSTENKEEQIVIEQNKIVYIDRTPYIDFETFFEKFKKIIEEVQILIKNELNLQDIGLRYINNFNLPMEHLTEAFMIHPTISCQENDEFYAYSNTHTSVANLISMEDNLINATVQTVFQVPEQSLLNITFDIDTHLSTRYTLDNIYNFYNELTKLRNFKNQIFFSNFTGAYNLKAVEPVIENPLN